MGCLLAQAIFNREDDEKLEAIAQDVAGLLEAHPLYPDL